MYAFYASTQTVVCYCCTGLNLGEGGLFWSQKVPYSYISDFHPPYDIKILAQSRCLSRAVSPNFDRKVTLNYHDYRSNDYGTKIYFGITRTLQVLLLEISCISFLSCIFERNVLHCINSSWRLRLDFGWISKITAALSTEFISMSM